MRQFFRGQARATDAADNEQDIFGCNATWRHCSPFDGAAHDFERIAGEQVDVKFVSTPGKLNPPTRRRIPIIYSFSDVNVSEPRYGTG